LVSDIAGLTANEVAAKVEGTEGSVQFVLTEVMTALRALETASQMEVRHSGLQNMLTQPEFGGADARGMLDLLRGGAFVQAVLPQVASVSDVQVFIGDENPSDELRRFGIVVSTYGVDGEVTGLLGVVGPTRMAYGRSISSVRYMARLMSDLMTDLYSA
jgi:heat-inducible transcriptional repressor